MVAWLVHGTPGTDSDEPDGMPHWSAENAEDVLRFMLAIYESSETGKRVTLG